MCVPLSASYVALQALGKALKLGPHAAGRAYPSGASAQLMQVAGPQEVSKVYPRLGSAQLMHMAGPHRTGKAYPRLGSAQLMQVAGPHGTGKARGKWRPPGAWFCWLLMQFLLRVLHVLLPPVHSFTLTTTGHGLSDVNNILQS